MSKKEEKLKDLDMREIGKALEEAYEVIRTADGIIRAMVKQSKPNVESYADLYESTCLMELIGNYIGIVSELKCACCDDYVLPQYREDAPGDKDAEPEGEGE